jgi:uncharacterized membrane protein
MGTANYGRLFPELLPIRSDSFERFGRRLVIDFGLAGVLDRFERTFGTRATNLLLGLIGATVVVVCIGLIFSTIMPVVWWFIEKDQTLENIHFARGLAALIAFVLLVVMIVNIIASYFERRALDRALRRAADRADEYFSEAKELHELTLAESDRLKALSQELRWIEKHIRGGPL